MALWGSPSGGGRPPGYIELPTLVPSHQHDDAADDDTPLHETSIFFLLFRGW